MISASSTLATTLSNTASSPLKPIKRRLVSRKVQAERLAKKQALAHAASLKKGQEEKIVTVARGKFLLLASGLPHTNGIMEKCSTIVNGSI